MPWATNKRDKSQPSDWIKGKRASKCETSQRKLYQGRGLAGDLGARNSCQRQQQHMQLGHGANEKLLTKDSQMEACPRASSRPDICVRHTHR